MFWPIIFDSMNKVLEEIQINEILEINEESKKYGLILTAEEATEIMEGRNRVLKSCGRVELGIEVTKIIIQKFSNSSFINQEEYTLALNELHEVFYYMKNETEDKIGDSELIDIIKNYFDNFCGGSLELLKGRELETFARNFRRGNQITDYLLEGEER